MLLSRDGGCWIASTNGLLLFRDPQAVADESRLLELPNVSIAALAEGFDHSFWAGSRAGDLWRLARGQWQRLAHFPATNGISALVPERDGSLWVGTDGNGLYRWSESSTLQANHAQRSGIGRTLSVTCVMMPSVPNEPVSSLQKS